MEIRSVIDFVFVGIESSFYRPQVSSVVIPFAKVRNEGFDGIRYDKHPRSSQQNSMRFDYDADFSAIENDH